MWNRLSIVLLFVLGIVVYAQDTEPYVEVYQPAVNVRSGPSEQYLSRGAMWSGDRLTVTGKSNFTGTQSCTDDSNYENDLWLRVDVQGIEGWVNYCVVKFAGNLDHLPIAVSAYPEVDEWLNLATIPLDGIFFSTIRDELGSVPDVPSVIGLTRTRNFIHLRQEPRLDANILDHISGEQVYVTDVSSDGVWVRVEYDAKLSSCLQEAQSHTACAYQRISGWVARYLLFLPTDWQDTFANGS